MTTTDLSAEILSRLESLENLVADAGLRVVRNGSGLAPEQLAAALQDVEQAMPPLRRLLARLPGEGESRADARESP
jgi:hypothetical protein